MATKREQQDEIHRDVLRKRGVTPQSMMSHVIREHIPPPAMTMKEKAWKKMPKTNLPWKPKRRKFMKHKMIRMTPKERIR